MFRKPHVHIRCNILKASLVRYIIGELGRQLSGSSACHASLRARVQIPGIHAKPVRCSCYLSSREAGESTGMLARQPGQIEPQAGERFSLKNSGRQADSS